MIYHFEFCILPCFTIWIVASPLRAILLYPKVLARRRICVGKKMKSYKRHTNGI
jgi:hypothetical protein